MRPSLSSLLSCASYFSIRLFLEWLHWRKNSSQEGIHAEANVQIQRLPCEDGLFVLLTSLRDPHSLTHSHIRAHSHNFPSGRRVVNIVIEEAKKGKSVGASWVRYHNHFVKTPWHGGEVYSVHPTDIFQSFYPFWHVRIAYEDQMSAMPLFPMHNESSFSKYASTTLTIWTMVSAGNGSKD